MDLTEDINMQALAIEKTLTTEKLLLRDTVKNFEFKFAEFKLEIQKDVKSINASLEGKAEMMFDIVNSSSTALANGIVELKSDLNDSINNINQFLATMETTMKSNFEDLETRMVANATKKENEIYDMAKSSALALETGIAGLTSNWNSTTNNISEILKTMEMNMQSYMTEIEKKMRDEVTKNQSVTQNTLNSLQTSFSSVSTVVSSISYQQTSAIQCRRCTRVYYQSHHLCLPFRTNKLIRYNQHFHRCPRGYRRSNHLCRPIRHTCHLEYRRFQRGQRHFPQ